MNCREFEAAWNELLDARSSPAPELERSIEAHALACGTCRASSSRYQTLRQALPAWPPVPSPSPESMARLRSLTVPAPRRRRLAPVVVRWSALPLASAAALLLMIRLDGFGPSTAPPIDPEPAHAPAPSASASARPLGEALADATAATLDLARQTSAPAGRIGREVLELEADALAPRPEGEPPVEVDNPGSNDLLRSVGERVNAGVKPLSGSARHAFSFLLGPPPEDAPAGSGDGF